MTDLVIGMLAGLAIGRALWHPRRLLAAETRARLEEAREARAEARAEGVAEGLAAAKGSCADCRWRNGGRMVERVYEVAP